MEDDFAVSLNAGKVKRDRSRRQASNGGENPMGYPISNEIENDINQRDNSIQPKPSSKTVYVP